MDEETAAAAVHVAEKYRAQLPKADIGKSCIRFRKFEYNEQFAPVSCPR